MYLIFFSFTKAKSHKIMRQFGDVVVVADYAL